MTMISMSMSDSFLSHSISVGLSDIDECEIGRNGGCQGGCVNDIGSFYCTCEEGYVVNNTYFCSGV